MKIVLGKTGSNLTAGMFLMKRSTLFKNIVLFLSQPMSSDPSDPKFSKNIGLWDSAQEGLDSKVLSFN